MTWSLRRRAEEAGQSLQQYLATELTRADAATRGLAERSHILELPSARAQITLGTFARQVANRSPASSQR